MYKIFNFSIKLTRLFENLFQGISILALFYLILYTLYSMLLLGASNAMDFFKPSAEIIIAIANALWIFGEPFNSILTEFIGGAILLLFLFAFFQLLRKIAQSIEQNLIIAQNRYRENEDRTVNQQLHKDIEKMNKKLSQCILYYEIKKKDNIHFPVNLEEQYQALNQFLYSKSSIIPEKYEEGYLLKIQSIENIDELLSSLFKAINSTAPVDYIFILQIVEDTSYNALVEINKLKNTKLYNKIVMTLTTNLRYEHNEVKNYTTSIAGSFIFEGEDLAIYEFREKFL